MQSTMVIPTVGPTPVGPKRRNLTEAGGTAQMGAAPRVVKTPRRSQTRSGLFEVVAVLSACELPILPLSDPPLNDTSAPPSKDARNRVVGPGRDGIRRVDGRVDSMPTTTSLRALWSGCSEGKSCSPLLGGHVRIQEPGDHASREHDSPSNRRAAH